MHIINAFIIAFSLYSALPMPQVEWKEKDMSLALAFFPLVGLASGGALWLWQELCRYLGLTTVLFAAGGVALPLLVTGGIHLDGFCDTLDALCSHQNREEKLRILKDPHMGAFAGMGCMLLLLLRFGLLYELATRGLSLWLLPLFCVVSRVCSGFLVLTMPSARPKGMLDTVRAPANRPWVLGILGLWLVFGGGVALVLAPTAAGWLLLGCGLCTFFCRRLFFCQFQGITGDLAGYFLEICETILLAALVLSSYC